MAFTMQANVQASTQQDGHVVRRAIFHEPDAYGRRYISAVIIGSVDNPIAFLDIDGTLLPSPLLVCPVGEDDERRHRRCARSCWSGLSSRVWMSASGSRIPASQLLSLKPAGVHHAVAFLVDTEALTHPDRPILVINLYDYMEGSNDEGRGPQFGATFRVVPSEMWSVQNNLAISNMDWKDFAGNVDSDDIFRGFE